MEKRLLFVLILASFLVRAAYVVLFVDLTHTNYWEYGAIAGNLHAGKGYSLYSFDGETYSIHSPPVSAVFPSAYMMPGYVGILYVFFFLEDILLRNILILLFQCGLGAAAAFFMYRFMQEYASRRAAAVAAFITALLPEFVYAAGSFTPTVLFHFLFVVLLPMLYRLRTEHSRRSELFAALLIAALMYIRPEFILFAAAYIVYLIVVNRPRVALHVSLFVVLALFPWQARNAIVFHEWIPLTTSSGLNFFRGHNSLELGTFGDEAIIRGVRDLPEGSGFEPAMSRLYYNRAFEYVRENPLMEITNPPIKMFQLWFWNPSDGRTTSVLYLIPWMLILAGGVWGGLKSSAWRRHAILIMYMGAATVVAVAFFVLPRYQTMMKIAVIPFAALGFLSAWDSLRARLPRLWR